MFMSFIPRSESFLTKHIIFIKTFLVLLKSKRKVHLNSWKCLQSKWNKIQNFPFLVQAVLCKDFIHRWWLLPSEPNEGIQGEAVFCWQFIWAFKWCSPGWNNLSQPFHHLSLMEASSAIVNISELFYSSSRLFLALPPPRFLWLEIASVCGWAEQDTHSWDNRGSAPGPEAAKILSSPDEQEITQL